MTAPAQDRVAVAAVRCTPYTRHGGRRTAAGLATDAVADAMAAAGLRPEDVDGLAGTSVPTTVVQASLGIPEVTWWANHGLPFSHAFVAAVHAVAAGACTSAVAYHATYRGAGASRSARTDPYRTRAAADPHGHNVGTEPETPTGTYGYCAWAARYLHRYRQSRDVLGLVAVNGRSNARRNPHALFREPITLDDYRAARLIREPLGLLDMDPPADGADAFVITTAERARDLTDRPVLVHAAAFGRTARPFADQLEDYEVSGKEIVARQLWSSSALTLDDLDVVQVYDGFSIMALSWIEAIGWCKAGEAGPFLLDHWDTRADRLVIGGRIPVNTHGGSLSEGASQGAGHLREACDQLAGVAGDRQVPGAAAALATVGGFLWNASAVLLRADDH